MEQTRPITAHIYLGAELRTAVDREAETRNWTMSTVIRQALREYIERHSIEGAAK